MGWGKEGRDGWGRMWERGWGLIQTFRQTRPQDIGTHAELMTRSEVYQQLVRRQIVGMDDEGARGEGGAKGEGAEGGRQ